MVLYILLLSLNQAAPDNRQRVGIPKSSGMAPPPISESARTAAATTASLLAVAVAIDRRRCGIVDCKSNQFFFHF